MSRATAVKGLTAVAVALFLSSPAQAASLTIPAIGMRERVSNALNAGPSWWPDSHRPGAGGTVAIAGHRTTHTRPFHDLHKLRRGDRIYLRSGGRVYRYIVNRWRVRPESDLHITDDLGYERLILSACARADGSPTSATYRIVVYARPQ